MAKIKIRKRKPIIGYSGALVQQHFGEDLNHGIVVWDLKNHSYHFQPIYNEIGYCTVNIHNGKIVESREFIDTFPTKLKLRLKYSNTTDSQINDIVRIFKAKFNIIELALIKDKRFEVKNNGGKISIGDMRDVENQNELMTKYVNEVLSDPNIDIDMLRHINRIINSKIEDEKTLVRNVTWQILDLKFSNMFSYGEDNYINIENINGITGIFAPNASGKSSLIDVISYALFDKCSRTSKGRYILNNRKETFYCKIRLDINGVEYQIERIGKLIKRNDNVRVEVNFGKFNNGQYTSLNGKDRDDTNNIIRGYLGTYDDFLLTAVSTQNDDKNFIFKNQRERKMLLNSFMDINIFEKLYILAKDEVREKEGALKVLENEFELKELEEIDSQIIQAQNKITEYKKQKTGYNEKLYNYEDELAQITITNITETYDIDGLNSKLNKINSELDNNNIKELTNQIKIWKKQDLSVLYNPINEYNKVIQLLNELNSNKKVLNSKIESINEKLEHLKNHEYDPNCQYCVKNPFVQDAYDAQNKLPLLQRQLDDINIQISYNQMEFEKLEMQKEQFDYLDGIRENIANNERLLINQKEKREYLKNIKRNIEKDIRKYQKQAEIQKENEQKLVKIEFLKGEISNLRKLIENCDKIIIENRTSLQFLNKKYEQLTEQYEKIKDLNKIVNVYNDYTNIISKNGLPYYLIQTILPLIQDNVNEILGRVTDFYTTFEAIDNNISCYIHYSDDKKWPVEMGSGMEKFMVQVAIRDALLNISILPRPNFIAIDEGFGVLDSDMLNSIDTLFDYLKTKYKFILCISHLDSLRDNVNAIINIKKSDTGFSHINLT